MEPNFYQPLLATLVILMVWHLLIHLSIEFVKPAFSLCHDLYDKESDRKLFRQHHESNGERIWAIFMLHTFYIIRISLAQSTEPIDIRFFRLIEPALHTFMFFVNIYYTYFIKTDKVLV